MDAASKILQEYLVAIGFKVDTSEVNRTNKVLGGIEKGFGNISKAAVGAMTAATAMVDAFASKMEKLYYASARSQSTVTNLQAMASGAERIGVGGDRMLAAIEGMARSIRLNPGLNGLLANLGVKVQGRDMSDVAVDTVKALKQLPFYVGAQYAQIFGIDPDTLLLLEEGVDKLQAAAEVRKNLARDLGVDSEEAAKAAVEYKNTWRDIQDYVSVLTDALAIKLLPGMRDFAGVVKGVLGDWVAIIRRTTSFSDFLTKFAEGVTGNSTHEGAMLSVESLQRLNDPATAAKLRAMDADFKGGSKGAAAGGGAPSDARAKLGQLEQKYALPAGLLDSMWLQESGRGTNMLGRETKSGRAEGHFQFVPSTAREMGLKNPYDFDESAAKAAAYMSQLLKANGGDLDRALAAYNWGQGNLNKYSLGSAPAETRNYIRDIEGRMQNVNVNTTISVHGSSDAAATAHAVAGEQKRVASDVARNLLPRGPR